MLTEIHTAVSLSDNVGSFYAERHCYNPDAKRIGIIPKGFGSILLKDKSVPIALDDFAEMIAESCISMQSIYHKSDNTVYLVTTDIDGVIRVHRCKEHPIEADSNIDNRGNKLFWLIEIENAKNELTDYTLYNMQTVDDKLFLCISNFHNHLLVLDTIATTRIELNIFSKSIHCALDQLQLTPNDQNQESDNPYSGLRPAASALWRAILSTNFFVGMGAWTDVVHSDDTEAHSAFRNWTLLVEQSFQPISYVCNSQK